MIGYRNAVYIPQEECVRVYSWNENGERVSYDSHYTPYVMIEDANGKDISIFNTKLRTRKFKSQFDRNKFIKDCGTKRLFENLNPVQQFLVDAFWKHNNDSDFGKFPVRVAFIDIEVFSPLSFPTAEQAGHPINIITIHDSLTNKLYSWGTKEYKHNRDDLVYNFCKTERQLLLEFLEFFETMQADLLTGWNSVGFDIPYIINRINNTIGEEHSQRLSPVRRVYNRILNSGMFGKQQIRWYIDGISCVDYIDIYKRFSFVNRESYKLDHIAELELGEKKIDYGNTNLASLSIEDWQLFVDYNLQDVMLLVKMDLKLQYIALLRMLAYMGLTTIENAMSTLSTISGTAAIRARQKGKYLPTFIRGDDDSKNPGAFVAEPLEGFQASVVSFDANSLYPNIMISLNMSPETKVGRIIESEDSDITIQHINGSIHKLDAVKFAKFVKDEKIAISKAKVLFSQKSKGILPEIVDEYYNERVAVRKEMMKLKKQNDKSTDIQDRIAQLNAKQLCIKIFINSVYGYMGNKNAPLGDDDIASSITLTGQFINKSSRSLAREYVANVLGHDKFEDIAVAGDTDSVVADAVIRTSCGNFTMEELYELCEERGGTTSISKTGHEFLTPSFDITTNCVDMGDCTMQNAKISKISKRKVKKEIYRLRADSGKYIDVTKDHSCIVMRNGKLISVKPIDIIKTDMLVIQKNLFMNDIKLVNIDSIEIINSDEQYVYDIEIDRDNAHNFFANDILVHNSVYLSIAPLLKHHNIPLLTDGKVTPQVYEVIDNLNNYINEKVKERMINSLNSLDPRIFFKRESIIDKGLFLQKKRYVAHVVDDEGIVCDKWKYVGVEVVRTAMPKAIKPYVKKIIETMIGVQNRADTNKVLNEAYEVLKSLKPEEIAYVMGMKDYDKHANNCKDFTTAKGMPVHVKSAYFYNTLLKKLDLETKYEKLQSGDKLRWMYIKTPNKYNIKTIAFKYYYPAEFSALFQPDYETMFEKIIFSVVERFYAAVKWPSHKPNEQTTVDLFDLFG